MATDDGFRWRRGRVSDSITDGWLGTYFFFSFLNPNLKLDSKQLFITCQERLAFDYQTHIE